jgi:hypothetical protein
MLRRKIAAQEVRAAQLASIDNVAQRDCLSQAREQFSPPRN